MIGAIENVFYIALVLLGFGFVIFIHELGHFAAARWAKIRVHEFAVGFGPAMVSFRKGIGVRRGSTNERYAQMVREHNGEPPNVSQTEYRLNWVPLGGYVKMLGQEDANPGATSSAPDSYTSVPVWKRMVVVSAGVIMNVILAAILFVAVYAVGLEANAPAVRVYEDTPAYAGGLRTGDIVRTVNGNDVEVFQDLVLQVGLSKKGGPLAIGVERPGEGLLTFDVEPEYDAEAEIRAIGAFAMPGTTVITPPDEQRERFDERVAEMGLAGLEPGMVLVEVDGEEVTHANVEPWGTVDLPTQVLAAAERSGGAPVQLGFAPAEGADGAVVRLGFVPRPVFGRVEVDLDDETTDTISHLLGITGPLAVASVSDPGAEAGLEDGDVFASIDGGAWPDFGAAIRAIRAKAGSSVNARLLRDGAFVELELPVSDAGTIGFRPDIAMDGEVLAAAPAPGLPIEHSGLRAGDRLLEIDGAVVGSIAEAYAPLVAATADAHDAGSGASVEVFIERDGSPITLSWALSAEDVRALHALGWSGDHALALFAPATVLQIGYDPGHSVVLGLRETKRMLTRVYLTLGRLADGSVKPQQLKGPVGITHIGSRVARDGVIRLLFFIGLISANLAVLNFLPLPIVDGGLFLMLVYEGVFKKPVPPAVQNGLTLVGLVLIAAVFLFVTTNDVLNLFG